VDWRSTVGAELQPQLLDLALLAAIMTLALVSFFRKTVALKYVTFVAAVGYLGFTKSSLVSVSDVFRLTDLSVPELKYSLAWYLFMTFVVVTTVLWGRVYCGRVCAFGALTQLMDPIIPRQMRIEIPVRIEKYANQIKYGVLAAVLAYFLITKDVAGPIRYAEPFWMFGLFGTTAMWTGLAVLLVATVFVRNLYCRFLCPSARRSIVSQVTTVFRIKRWSECNSRKI
jgi:polyferredoxin